MNIIKALLLFTVCFNSNAGIMSHDTSGAIIGGVTTGSSVTDENGLLKRGLDVTVKGTLSSSANGALVPLQVNQVGATLSESFGTEVARGLYPTYSIKNKFGHNDDIDTGTTPEDIIHGGGTYTGFNATANENIEALSASASDVGTVLSSGTVTVAGTTELIDSTAIFITNAVAIGDIIINDTNGYHGFVTSIVSEIQLNVTRMIDGPNVIAENAIGDAYRVVESASTGAAVIRLEGLLDLAGDSQTPSYIVMNGATGVILTGNYVRCSRVKVVHAGSGGFNAGEITVRQETTTANIFTLLDTIGQSENTLDTVPNGKSAVIKTIRSTIIRASGAAGSAHIILFSREKGGSWNAREILATATGTSIDQKYIGGIILKAGTDFKMTVNDVSDSNTEAAGSMEYYFIDDMAP